MIAKVSKDGLLGLHNVLTTFLSLVFSGLTSLTFRFQYSFHELINLRLDDIFTQVFKVFCTQFCFLKLLSIHHDIFAELIQRLLSVIGRLVLREFVEVVRFLMQQVFKEIFAHLAVECGLSLTKAMHNLLVAVLSDLIDDWFVAWVILILLQFLLCNCLVLNQMALSYGPFTLNNARVLCIGVIQA